MKVTAKDFSLRVFGDHLTYRRFIEESIMKHIMTYSSKYECFEGMQVMLYLKNNVFDCGIEIRLPYYWGYEGIVVHIHSLLKKYSDWLRWRCTKKEYSNCPNKDMCDFYHKGDDFVTDIIDENIKYLPARVRLYGDNINFCIWCLHKSQYELFCDDECRDRYKEFINFNKNMKRQRHGKKEE